jgi:hypothetical protein
MRDRLSSVTGAVHEALIHAHFQKMLVTKHTKVLARLGSRTRPNVLQPETVRQWNTLFPLDFEVVPQLVHSCASGSQMSRLYSLKVPGLGGFRSGGLQALVFSFRRQR